MYSVGAPPRSPHNVQTGYQPPSFRFVVSAGERCRHRRERLWSDSLRPPSRANHHRGVLAMCYVATGKNVALSPVGTSLTAVAVVENCGVRRPSTARFVGILSKMWLLSCLYSNRLYYQTSRLLTDTAHSGATARLVVSAVSTIQRISFLIDWSVSRSAAPGDRDDSRRSERTKGWPGTNAPTEHTQLAPRWTPNQFTVQ